MHLLLLIYNASLTPYLPTPLFSFFLSFSLKHLVYMYERFVVMHICVQRACLEHEEV